MGSHGKAAALLFIAAACVYFPLLVPGTVPFSAYSDIFAFHVAYKDVLWSSLSEHQLPLWRTDQMLGAPALSQPQTLFLHPLHALFWLLPPAAAFGPSLVLCLWVGALGAYALSCTLGTSFRSALLAGIAQLVCFKLIAVCFAGWASQLATLVTLPWVLCAWLSYLKQPALPGFVALSGALFVGLSGGSPQVLYYLALVLLAAPLLLGGGLQRRTSLHASLRAWAALAAAFLLAFLGNAYLWLPVLADMPLLSRAEQSLAFFHSGHWLRPLHLTTLLHPEWLGSPLEGTYRGVELWEDVAYFGVVPLAFVLGALVCVRRFKAPAHFLLLAFFLSLLLSLSSPLLAAVHAWVPGYALFRLPGRMLFISALCGIALFALGVDALFAYLSRKSPRAPALAFCALGLIMLGEGTFYARSYLSTRDAAHLHPDKDHPARKLRAAPYARAAVVGRGSLNYAWAHSLGLELVNGGDAYQYAHVRAYLALVEHGSTENQESPWLDLRTLARPDLLRDLAVEHVLSMRPLALPELSLVQHAENVRNFVLYKGEREAPLYVYRLSDPRPRARLVQAVEVLDSLEHVAARLAREPQADRALLVAQAGVQYAAAAPSALDTVTEIERTPERFKLRVRSEGTRFLLLSEAYHPGFRAHIDGIEAPLQMANLALLGMWMPPGTHEVEVVFDPPALRWGIGLSCLAALVWLGLLLHVLRHRPPFTRFLASRKPPRETGPA